MARRSANAASLGKCPPKVTPGSAVGISPRRTTVFSRRRHLGIERLDVAGASLKPQPHHGRLPRTFTALFGGRPSGEEVGQSESTDRTDAQNVPSKEVAARDCAVFDIVGFC